MKRWFIVLVSLFIFALSARGQVVISLDMLNQNRNLEVEFRLVDSKTEEPISWA